jgi:transposase
MKRFLNEAQRKELKAAHRKEEELRYGDRIKAILCLDSGLDYVEAAEYLLCDEKTIRNYEQRYLSGGLEALLSDNHRGGSGKLTKEQEEKLKAHLRENLYPTAKAINDYIKKSVGIEYSISGVHELLGRLNFVYKKPKIVPGKGNPEAQLEFIEEYEDIRHEQGDFDKVYFVDAAHPQFNTTASYGWIERGTDVELPAHTGRQRLNLNGALDIDTHQVVVQAAETINAQSTIELFKALEEMNPLAATIWVILDNARYYRNKEVRQYLEHSRIVAVFLPPYSPNLNLIERVWKFFKKQVLYNVYYENFAAFRTAALHFFKTASNTYSAELDSLLTENFHLFENMEPRKIQL